LSAEEVKGEKEASRRVRLRRLMTSKMSDRNDEKEGSDTCAEAVGLK